jgi:myo-inositol-1(or 4)-monophosphatase
MPLSPEVSVAVRAAQRGADVVRTAGLGGGATVETKALPGDYVTEVDLAAERAIAELLAAEGGGVGVHGEERGGPSVADAWVVDPLDGTTNFAHGFWAVGVSVALVRDGRPVAGAICAPFLGQTWMAGSGEGAWSVRERGEPVRLAVSAHEPSRAVVGTGFPFRRKDLLSRYLGAFDGAISTFEDLRRPGAAALDLAWVAEGVFDGFFELALAPWDVAAGGLLITEAGGVVTDWRGDDRAWLDGDILAGGAAVHGALLEIAREQGG